MSRKVQIFGMTDVGRVRDHNEDNFLISKDLEKKDWSYKRDESIELGAWGALLLVADGMGGTNAGEVASHIAQESVKEEFERLTQIPEGEKKREQLLVKVIKTAHDQIVKHQRENLETAGMGTTLIIAWLIGDKLHVAWSGDSRCYVYRGEEHLQPFSEDHSLVWSLVKAGEISPEEARTHSESNIITQSLGEPSRPPKPSAKSTVLHPGDKVLVCSDGLNGMLSDEQIRHYLAQDLPVADICRQLTDAANQAGGTDNITVLMAQVLQDGAKEAVHQTMAGLQDGKNSDSQSQPEGPTKTQVLRKKLNLRSYLLLAALLFIILIFVRNWLLPGEADGNKIIRIQLEPRSYAFTPNMPDSMNLSAFLLGGNRRLDSFSVTGMNYERTGRNAGISFRLGENASPNARVTLYPDRSDTIYLAEIRFRKAEEEISPAQRSSSALPGEDAAIGNREEEGPAAHGEEVAADTVENESPGPRSDSIRVGAKIPDPMEQFGDTLQAPGAPGGSELPKVDSIRRNLPPLNKVKGKEDSLINKNQ